MWVLLSAPLWWSCEKTSPTVYTVTFATDGGSSVPKQRVESGKKAKKPDAPVKSGYEFVDWHSDKALIQVYQFAQPVTSNITLYAKWTKKVSLPTSLTISTAENATSVVLSDALRFRATVVPATADAGVTWSIDDNDVANSKGMITVEGLYTAPVAVPDPATVTIRATSKVAESVTAIKLITIIQQPPPSDPLGGLMYAISTSKKVPSQAELDNVVPARIIFSALRPSADATVELLHVKAGGDDARDGTSWYKAKKTIQSALDAVTGEGASKVYVILIGAGTYTPATTLSMKNHVAIIGGFEALGSYEKGDGSVISGSNTRRVFESTDLDATTGGTTTSSTAVLARVTVTRGSSTTTNGGGMANNDSSPTLTDVTFSDNRAKGAGGGMYNINSSPTLTDVTFSGNTANYGGGMDNTSGSSPTLTDVTFSDNRAKYGGGGMDNSNSSPTLTDVTFSGNNAEYGGGMYNLNSSPTVTQVTFFGNTATDKGGGMYNAPGSPTLTAVTFSGNTASTGGGGMGNFGSSPTLTAVTFFGNHAGDGGGMHNKLSSSPTIAGAIFWGNTKGAANTPDQVVNVENSTPILAHSIVQGATANDTTGISATDPNLSALADNGGVVQTRAIGAGSSAVNTGLYFARSGSTNYYSADNTTWYTTPLLTGTVATLPADATKYTTDARGYGYSGRPDIGAYEYGGTAPTTP